MAQPRRARSRTPDSDAAADLTKLPVASVETQLGVSADGISSAEAQARRARYGYNELPEQHVHPLLKFLSYFWGPFPWMIEVAALLSAVVRHWEDFVIILALLFIGEIVPADARLLQGDPIEVDQSALTGESLPVERKAGDAVFSGSIVKQGEADALVIATGANTYFGTTARLVETARTVSHFQRAVLKIGDFLIVVALILVVLILAVALFRGDPMLTTLQFALVLTVDSVPVAMPAVLSVTMAVGARKLAERQAIVTHLGGWRTLCSPLTAYPR